MEGPGDSRQSAWQRELHGSRQFADLHISRQFLPSTGLQGEEFPALRTAPLYPGWQLYAEGYTAGRQLPSRTDYLEPLLARATLLSRQHRRKWSYYLAGGPLEQQHLEQYLKMQYVLSQSRMIEHRRPLERLQQDTREKETTKTVIRELIPSEQEFIPPGLLQQQQWLLENIRQAAPVDRPEQRPGYRTQKETAVSLLTGDAPLDLSLSGQHEHAASRAAYWFEQLAHHVHRQYHRLHQHFLEKHRAFQQQFPGYFLGKTAGKLVQRVYLPGLAFPGQAKQQGLLPEHLTGGAAWLQQGTALYDAGAPVPGFREQGRKAPVPFSPTFIAWYSQPAAQARAAGPEVHLVSRHLSRFAREIIQRQTIKAGLPQPGQQPGPAVWMVPGQRSATQAAGQAEIFSPAAVSFPGQAKQQGLLPEHLTGGAAWLQQGTALYDAGAPVPGFREQGRKAPVPFSPTFIAWYSQPAAQARAAGPEVHLVSRHLSRFAREIIQRQTIKAGLPQPGQQPGPAQWLGPGVKGASQPGWQGQDVKSASQAALQTDLATMPALTFPAHVLQQSLLPGYASRVAVEAQRSADIEYRTSQHFLESREQRRDQAIPEQQPMEALRFGQTDFSQAIVSRDLERVLASSPLRVIEHILSSSYLQLKERLAGLQQHYSRHFSRYLSQDQSFNQFVNQQGVKQAQVQPLHLQIYQQQQQNVSQLLHMTRPISRFAYQALPEDKGVQAALPMKTDLRDQLQWPGTRFSLAVHTVEQSLKTFQELSFKHHRMLHRAPQQPLDDVLSRPMKLPEHGYEEASLFADLPQAELPGRRALQVVRFYPEEKLPQRMFFHPAEEKKAAGTRDDKAAGPLLISSFTTQFFPAQTLLSTQQVHSAALQQFRQPLQSLLFIHPDKRTVDMKEKQEFFQRFQHLPVGEKPVRHTSLANMTLELSGELTKPLKLEQLEPIKSFPRQVQALSAAMAPGWQQAGREPLQQEGRTTGRRDYQGTDPLSLPGAVARYTTALMEQHLLTHRRAGDVFPAPASGALAQGVQAGKRPLPGEFEQEPGQEPYQLAMRQQIPAALSFPQVSGVLSGALPSGAGEVFPPGEALSADSRQDSDPGLIHRTSRPAEESRQVVHEEYEEEEEPIIEEITEETRYAPVTEEYRFEDPEAKWNKFIEKLDLESMIPLTSLEEKIYARIEKKLISERRRRGL